ncbi:nicotinamide mononucleotide transporter [Andreprevotia lacus DSM 23236]|jgi:nicotinamide mononucleotide transporter|uniref:Nicotinamide riboside transporter PnuC n=1 Tax=Andreprevotia lacus DSM 23236 TaxID=1121001 RepID=A0A1W1X6R5_9NEIS|nr:nicotinamide riboside transporter PnuC [Andreprevotia lacus]SMC19626.1 nicotinamide mononucleotide transporter [Andreprevotia lacus DSM 23236]
MMPSPLEIAASITTAASVWLAARNNVHTWWIGVVGCVLYGWVFFDARLYADVTLQGFFIVSSMAGWLNWLRGAQGAPVAVRRTRLPHAVALAALSVLVAIAYAAVLHRFTDAWNPWLDSLVLTFSVLAQFLLMGRRLENWFAWLLVNTIAVPLYFARELYLSAGLYLVFWCNAWYGLYRWRQELAEAAPDGVAVAA